MREKLNKPYALGALMGAGSIVQVVLDSRREGVVLPKQHMDKEAVTLEMGHNLPVPMRDFYVDAFGVTVGLSFGRTPHTCFLPWHAIFCIKYKDGDVGYTWDEDVPADVEVSQEPREERLEARTAGERTTSTGRTLRSV